MSKTKPNKEFRAIVQRVVREGPHGPYAIDRLDDASGTSVTFSLQKPVWNESCFPEEGEVVILSDVREKRAGWRAHKAKFSRR